MFFYSSYLDCIYRKPKKYAMLVDKVVKEVLRLKKTRRFHAIAFRGSSGAAMAYPVSVATGIPLIHIRKPVEKTHGGKIEGSPDIGVKKYIIIDDFIDSGETMREIIAAIDNYDYDGEIIECVGIVLYTDENSFKKWQDILVTRIK